MEVCEVNENRSAAIPQLRRVDGPRRPSPLRRPRNASAYPPRGLPPEFGLFSNLAACISAETHVLPAAFQVLCGDDGAVAGERRGVLGNIVLPTS
jgi:hypothetical protein